MKHALRGASGAAILIALGGAVVPASAQEPVETVRTTESVETDETSHDQRRMERVVVTGSNIRGTPLDTALPVEVYSQADLEARGAPTALEFAKSLTISGPTSGESYYFGGPALTGSVNFNLRGIGADKTLTLLNGRRVSENLSNIPGIAVERTEVLKDGAAVIYGADAVGGVVNFITRSGFTGFEASGDYKFIDGSDGDYDIGLLGGFDAFGNDADLHLQRHRHQGLDDCATSDVSEQIVDE